LSKEDGSVGIILINKSRCNQCKKCIVACPFNAIELVDDTVDINSSCKMCGICIKACEQKCISRMEERQVQIGLDEWEGILVFIEYTLGKIHPVSFELIGKAKELAKRSNQHVYCVLIGSGVDGKVHELVGYGIEKVFVYEHEQLQFFRADVYANAFEDCIRRIKPSIVLIGATTIGRSLAPRLSTRFRTGLTADCTVLDVKENSDLVQIRPAFGGNIMAQIVTRKTRPQFATVRYKTMEQPCKSGDGNTLIEHCKIPKDKLKSKINVIEVVRKEISLDISESEVLIVGGRGLKTSKDLDMLETLASMLEGQVAVTRPLIEAGWASYTRQVGLSGRTVKPKLMITCGVSGAIQFTACMGMSENIIAINSDRNASIFKIAHYGIIGDLYEIVPELISRIAGGEVTCNIRE